MERDLPPFAGPVLQALVARSSAALLVLDLDLGRFVYGNEAAARLLGVPPQEFERYGPEQVSPPLQPDSRPSEEGIRHWIGRAQAEGSAAFEWLCRTPAGEDVSCEVRLAFLPCEGRRLILGTVVDLRGRRRFEDVLRRVVEGTGAAGEAYLPALTRSLAESLGARHSFLCEFLPGRKRAVVAAAWSDGRSLEPMEYELEGTPCGEVVQSGLRYYRSGVRNLFPRDPDLARLGADCYLGVLLRSSVGEPLGILAVMHDRALDEFSRPEAVLLAFATGAASQLAHARAERILRESEARYHGIVHALNDGIVVLDPEGRILQANPAAACMFGLGERDLQARALPDLLHPASRHQVDDCLAAVGCGRKYAGRLRAMGSPRTWSGYPFPARGSPAPSRS